MGVGRGRGRRMEVNKWLPSFVGMKRKPKKKKETSEGQTERRNEIGVRSLGRPSTRERKIYGDKLAVLDKFADSA
jgi:hypothetical protein